MHNDPQEKLQNRIQERVQVRQAVQHLVQEGVQEDPAKELQDSVWQEMPSDTKAKLQDNLQPKV